MLQAKNRSSKISLHCPFNNDVYTNPISERSPWGLQVVMIQILIGWRFRHVFCLIRPSRVGSEGGAQRSAANSRTKNAAKPCQRNWGGGGGGQWGETERVLFRRGRVVHGTMKKTWRRIEVGFLDSSTKMMTLMRKKIKMWYIF